MLQNYHNVIEKFVIVGDRVLLKPRDMETRTSSGLVLPSTVKEKEEIQSGYVLKTGPGYPIPSANGGYNEPWKEDDANTSYIGMQADEGDLAIYMKSRAHEIEFENEKYIIVPHGAILLLIRDDLE
jgi:co-chaperonin GroES (HSP10)